MKSDSAKCIFVVLIVTIFAHANGLPNKKKTTKSESIEVSTLKIITIQPEDVGLPAVTTEPTKAPTLRRLDDVDQSDSPMYKIKSLEDGYHPGPRRNRKKTVSENKIEKESKTVKPEDVPVPVQVPVFVQAAPPPMQRSKDGRKQSVKKAVR